MNKFEKFVLKTEDLLNVSNKTASKYSINIVNNKDNSIPMIEDLLELLKNIKIFENSNTVFENRFVDSKLIVVNNTQTALKLNSMDKNINIFNLDIKNNMDVNNMLSNRETVDKLLDILLSNNISEVIFALDNNAEEDLIINSFSTTIKADSEGIKISKIATGIPVGADILYSSENTVKKALMNREKK